MIRITVNGKHYHGPEPGHWDQLTIAKCIKMSTICRTMPKGLRDLYLAWVQDDPVKQSEVVSSWPAGASEIEHPIWMTKAIETLYDIPENSLSRNHIDDILSFYNRYVQLFIIGIIHMPLDYKPINMREFVHEGKRYLMPPSFETLKETIPAGLATSDQIAEALDLLTIARGLQEGKMELIPALVAALCLRPGEKYDSQVAVKRAKKFEALPMSIGLEVFFYCINFSFDASMSGLRSVTQVEDPRKPLKKAHWKRSATEAAYCKKSDLRKKSIKN